MKINVKKRDGRLEPLDLNKVHKVVAWAAEGLDVSPSQVELKSHVQFHEGITTESIHEMLIKSAADLISEENPDYQYMASRLSLFHLRKIAYGEYTPPKLFDHIVKLTQEGWYDSNILSSYTKEEIDELDEVLDHDKDLNIAYAGIKQLEGKYLVQHRKEKRVKETPNMAFMVVAMVGFIDEDKEKRLELVKDFYKGLADFDISLPTPIMGGLRTGLLQYSSCFLPNQQVLTDNGYVEIKDISIGDTVLTKEGRYKKVITTNKKVFTGEKFVTMKATCSFRGDFASTEEHLVWAIKNGTDKPNWYRADELMVGDYVSIPINRVITPYREDTLMSYVENDLYNLDGEFIRKLTTDPKKRSGDFNDNISPCKNKITLTNDFYMLLGMFLGNGHCDKNVNTTVLTMNINHVEKHEFILKTFSEIFGVTPSISYNYNDNSVKISVYSYPIKQFFLHLAGTGFANKKLNEKIMLADREAQLHLLKGLFLTDGCLYNAGITVGLSNKYLVKQLSDICLRNNILHSLTSHLNNRNEDKPYYRKNGTITYFKNRKENFRLSISKLVGIDLINFVYGEHYQDKINKVFSNTKIKYYTNNNVLFREDGVFSKLTSVTHFSLNKDQIVHDIGVEDDHSFVAGTIGVHNCVTVETGDSLDSINATSNAIVKYISQRAGIGVNGGRIRALGSEIRGGEAIHTGVIPFWKVFQAAVKSCSQGALRGGAATLYYPLWHLEAESLLVLKNNKGVEENRIRQLDYGVQINKLLYTRLIKDQDITLFSPNAVPGMYEAFFADQEEFERLYTEAEKNPLIVQKKVPAKELFSLLLQERAATGRIYIQNVDHCNTHSAFNPEKAPITMSNLCVSGDTKVLVKINCTVQNVEIKSLVGKTVLAWNGEEFSETYFTQTSPSAMLWKVKLRNVETGETSVIYATKEHRWVDTVENIEYRTFELEEGMVFEGTTDNLTQTWNKVISVEEDVKEEPTYCGKEPKLGLLTFNGIITGNCLEITLPTKPLNDINDPNGEISLCTLSGINLGTLPKWDAKEEFLLEVKRRMYLLVRFLDNLLSYQEYPIPAARTATEKYRSLGIGPINYAYFLAKNGKRIVDGSGIEITHALFEAMQYFGLEASVELAKERGTCKAFDSTTYSQGLLPIDTYKKDIDSFAKVDYQLDWEQLRTSIKEHGLRNATITTVFPSETSSQVSNATNGIDPARGLITVKASKDGILKQVVPEIKTLKHQYDLLWDIPDNECFFKLVATMQKFVDQAISMNTHYDPKRFTNGKVPMVQLIKDMLTGYKYGIKTFYYHHTRDGADDTQSDIDDGCAGGACKL